MRSPFLSDRRVFHSTELQLRFFFRFVSLYFTCICVFCAYIHVPHVPVGGLRRSEEALDPQIWSYGWL